MRHVAMTAPSEPADTQRVSQAQCLRGSVGSIVIIFEKDNALSVGPVKHVLV